MASRGLPPLLAVDLDTATWTAADLEETRDLIVRLATENGWIGLSPDRPDEFMARLEAHRELVR